MPRSRHRPGTMLCVASVLALAVSACAPNGDTVADGKAADGTVSKRVPDELQPVDPAPAPPAARSPSTNQEGDMDASCNADAARGVIGKTATADVVEQARVSAGATVVRTLKPGQIVTMEYRGDRLNIDVDEDNVVIDVRCG